MIPTLKGSKLTSNVQRFKVNVQRFKVNVQRFKVTHAAWGKNLSTSVHFHHLVGISINHRRVENSMNVEILNRNNSKLTRHLLVLKPIPLLSSPREESVFSIYSTVYQASPNKKFYRIQTRPKNRHVQNIAHTLTHNTTHKNKMSRCLPTPSGFALYLHGNICHGPKPWCRGSPWVCFRRLGVGLLSPRLVPLVGMPNEDASKNREGGRSSALGGRRLVLDATINR